METFGLPFLLVRVETKRWRQQSTEAVEASLYHYHTSSFGSSVGTSCHRESILPQVLHIWDMQIFHTCGYFAGNIEHSKQKQHTHTHTYSIPVSAVKKTSFLHRLACVIYVPDSSEMSWVFLTEGMGILVWVPWRSGSSKKTEDAVIKDV